MKTNMSLLAERRSFFESICGYKHLAPTERRQGYSAHQAAEPKQKVLYWRSEEMGVTYFSVKIPLALAAGVIDINDFELSIEVQRRRSLFAIADAGAFNATKGNVSFAAGGW
jgi:hypothetical protein